MRKSFKLFNSIKRAGIVIPEFEDDTRFSGFLEVLADFPEDRYWTHEPKYGENAWIIEGRRYRILVWYHGNGHCSALGVLVDVPSLSYIR